MLARAPITRRTAAGHGFRAPVHAMGTNCAGQGDVVIDDQRGAPGATESRQRAGFSLPALLIVSKVTVLQHPCFAFQRQRTCREQIVAGFVRERVKTAVG